MLRHSEAPMVGCLFGSLLVWRVCVVYYIGVWRPPFPYISLYINLNLNLNLNLLQRGGDGNNTATEFWDGNQ